MDLRLQEHVDCRHRDFQATSLLRYGSAMCVCSLLQEYVPEAELPEIRRVLGDTLLDLCSEMHSEVRQDSLDRWSRPDQRLVTRRLVCV